MRIGIAGNGMIVRRMLQDIKGISEIELSAICVRAKSLEKGRDLAEEFGIPAVDTDYRTFLEREDMDTVYIGIVNQMHYEYAKKALEAGKHVICEKPFTVTVCEAKELEALADEKGLFLWEAFKIPYSPVFQAVKRHLGEIGAVKMVLLIRASFPFPIASHFHSIRCFYPIFHTPLQKAGHLSHTS